jgi:DeoR/GlpR family transcriptional regulator of sugar metabolism
LRYDNATKRRSLIVALVQETGFRSSSELGSLLNVSENTIRRDIHRLADEGLLEAVHGGARLTISQFGGRNFRSRMETNRTAKQAVARVACQFIKPNSIVALDAGTTVLELARILPRDMRLTIITHSMSTMTILSDREDIELIGLGGALRHTNQAFTGSLTIRAIQEFRVNTLFLATKAIHDNAIYSGNPYDAEIKQALIEVSDLVVLLVDSAKFQSRAGIRVVPLDKIDVIVVDNAIDANITGQMKKMNMELIVTPLEVSDHPAKSSNGK